MLLWVGRQKLRCVRFMFGVSYPSPLPVHEAVKYDVGELKARKPMPDLRTHCSDVPCPCVPFQQPKKRSQRTFVLFFSNPDLASQEKARVQINGFGVGPCDLTYDITASWEFCSWLPAWASNIILAMLRLAYVKQKLKPGGLLVYPWV